MRILITGISGQIGTNLALRCLAEGHDVYGIDLHPNSWTTLIRQSHCDLTHPCASTTLAQLLKSWGTPDIVVHLAAHAKVHQLVLEPHKALENIAMIQHILEYCRIQNVPIIFSSSREVYGNVYRPETREEDADFTQITSAYAASKLSGEALVYSYARCYELPYIVFRLSNVYGRFDNDLRRMERVIPLFIQNIQHGKSLKLFGSNKVLDFTYIDDCIDGIMLGIDCLVTGIVRNKTINLARGEGHTLGQLCLHLTKTLNIEVEIEDLPMQTGEVYHYVANLNRARELLGFSPKVSLLQGLHKAIIWSHEHLDKNHISS
jgi:UDP-glucose 4-epimerase